MNNQQRMTEQQFRKQTKQRGDFIHAGEELRTEFNKRIKALKLDEQAKEELFKIFKDCWNTGFECLYCGRKMSLHFENEYSFTIDHYLAKSKGGKDIPDNLVFCCRSCNFLKGNRSAENYLKNMGQLTARKNKREYFKARKSTKKDKQTRESYKEIFAAVNPKYKYQQTDEGHKDG